MVKLIIVDDEEMSRHYMVDCLPKDRQDLFFAGEADDGINGLELARKIKPDITLMDVRMPRMNGIECAKNTDV